MNFRAMDAPQPRSLSDRMALARRRVVAGALGLFVTAWIAVFALGRQPASTGRQATTSQASSTVAGAGPGSSATTDDSSGSVFDDEPSDDDSTQSLPSTGDDSSSSDV